MVIFNRTHFRGACRVSETTQKKSIALSTLTSPKESLAQVPSFVNGLSDPWQFPCAVFVFLFLNYKRCLFLTGVSGVIPLTFLCCRYFSQLVVSQFYGGFALRLQPVSSCLEKPVLPRIREKAFLFSS